MGCGVFKWEGTKLERFLHKNQHTQRKLLNFEFWINGNLSKIGHHFSNKNYLRIDYYRKMLKTKHALLNWYSSMKKMKKMIFDVEN